MTDDDVSFHSYPPAEMSADEFEQFVVDVLQQTEPEVDSLDIKLHEVVAGPDGSYHFDATVRYRLLGMDFLVLVEAKHDRHPIKREVVQALESKIRSVGAHKGVIVSTAQFQRGALEFAKSHGVALVQVTEGRFTFVQRSASPRPTPLSREVALEMGRTSVRRALLRQWLRAELHECHGCIRLPGVRRPLAPRHRRHEVAGW